MGHPCLACGACCAHYRVAFHWSEAEPALGGAVPPQLADRLDAHRLAMRGTDARRPHCVALQGEVGRGVRCGIYAHRPSVCREVAPAWETGEPSPQCDRARLAYGLAPLTRADWQALAAPAQAAAGTEASAPSKR